MSAEILKGIYLFEDMTAEELGKILNCSEEVVYQTGDYVFEQGDEAVALYVIKYGTVKIFQSSSSGDEIEVANLGTGSHFGEMSLMDRAKRSASVRINEKSELIKISYDKLEEALEANPSLGSHFYKALAKFLSGRLRKTTTDLGFARELNLRHF